MPDNTVPRDELRATLDARRELGEDYEPALVESFLDRLEAGIAARVKAEVDARASDPSPKDKQDVDPSIPIALGSLGIGIPLTAIAAGNAGFSGLLLAWGGIVAINVAYALSRGRRRGRGY
ncbi:hypothetical protein AB0K60_15065 [Thermopolyspora sp. NPDC052614]|uniref:hypothetical protein n=1 Tax=Thermopolyspora sp. NPDC052614 TaxID=3155682 RepID=UPI00342206F6